MIGGNDIVFPAVGDSASMEACARIVRKYWRNIRFEDAVTGDKYLQFEDIPFGKLRELLVYPDADAESSWDADSPNSPENSMLYLIVRPGDVTVVVDNPNATEMKSILHAIRECLWSDIRRNYASAA